MPIVHAYHRPSSIEEAIALLGRNVSTRVLGGGTVLSSELRAEGAEVVDLQELGLNGVCWEGETIHLGAMTTLDELSAHNDLNDGFRFLAHRELPSTLRTIATLGGTIAVGDWESELLAALLVHRAIVRIISTKGPTEVPLADLLAKRSLLDRSIIASVSIDPSGTTVSERTVRTGLDSAIVAVCGRRSSTGLAFAATGVSSVPLLIDGSNPIVSPPSDFRGSSAYRAQLVSVLTSRVTAQLSV